MVLGPEYFEPDDYNAEDQRGASPAYEGLVGVPLPPRQWYERINWYELVDNRPNSAGLRPRDITGYTELRFARAVHQLVANNVALDPNHITHPIIDRQLVDENLTTYYLRHPSYRVITPKQHADRIAYQDEKIEVVKQYLDTYPELPIVLSLRLAFRRRKQVHPTRAMFGLLSAYGQYLSDPPIPAPYNPY